MKDAASDSELLTSEQVMERLLAEPSLRRKAVSCVLAAVKFGNEWRFRRSDLEAWIAAQLARKNQAPKSVA